MRRQELHPLTAIINKTQKKHSKIAREKAFSWLVQTFPQAFDTTTHVRPLKIGIIDDIFAYLKEHPEMPISYSKIREVLVIFTRRLEYLACLKAREIRIDLNGNPTIPVTLEEAEKAAQKIKKRIEKNVKSSKNPSLELPTPKPFSFSETDPHYIERPPMFSAHTATSTEKPLTVVKHKSSRQFDPDAVARLKEKLGLSRKIKEEQT